MCILLCLMVIPSNDHGDTLPYKRTGCLHNYLRRTAKVMFSSLLVGLSVSNIMGKHMKGFLWNFQARSSKIQGTIWKKLGVLCLTPSIEERRYIEVYSSMIQFFISFFSRKYVLVSNITGKRMNGFSWNFQERLHIRQRKIWNIFGSWWLTPWIQDQFFYFVNP